MIKVINHRRYNTEKSEQVVFVDNNLHRHDFRYRSWSLHRTTKGAWFLHHYGGALTDMSIPCGSNGRGAGEELEPIGEEEALGFLELYSEQRDARAALEKYFAGAIDDA